jgi:hypothetical protein
VQFELIQPIKSAATAALLSSLQPAEPTAVLSALRPAELPTRDRRLKVELPDVGEPPPVETLLAHLEAENMQKEIDGKLSYHRTSAGTLILSRTSSNSYPDFIS